MLKSFEKIKKWWRKVFPQEINLNPKYIRIFWGVIFVVAISLILTIDFIPNPIELEEGQVSRMDITAPRTITFVDEEKTNELRERAAQSVGRVYEEDVNINKNVKRDFSDYFTVIRDAKRELALLESSAEGLQDREEGLLENEEGLREDIEDLQENGVGRQLLEEEKIIARIIEKNPAVSDETIANLLISSEEELQVLEIEAYRLVDNIYQQKFTPEDLPKIKEGVTQELMALDISREHRLALADLLEVFIRPNMIFDEVATNEKREEARKKVTPVTYTVRQDEMIVRSGDVVTGDDIKVLEALGLLKPEVNFLSITGVIFIVLSLVAIASIYLQKYKKEIWDDPGKLAFLEVMVLIILVLAKIIDLIPAVNYFYLPYLLPVAMVSILVTILISTETAMFITVFISLMVALLFNSDYSVALLGFVSGLVGIFSVSRLSQRNDLVRAGFNVSGVLSLLVIGLGFINYLDNWWHIVGDLIMAVANGIIVAIFANGLLPYLENFFGLTSSVKLLELSNPSHPLLSKMVFDAPGTYNHSLIVANLAETAANNIGANSLLARVGSYYHDIGKIKRPYFFTENHMGRENPHDKLSPNLSALIIKSHVKDGVELAREYKLPEQIIDIIKQHHGTNLIGYFYQQALEENKHDLVEESDFRYDGPKPKSKEAAIIMLADISEAAVRSKNFSKTNQNRIEGLVRELIRGKLIEGQLDESDLTFRELDIIIDSFVKVLTGIYHQRIDYPENVLKEMKKADKNDKDSNK